MKALRGYSPHPPPFLLSYVLEELQNWSRRKEGGGADTPFQLVQLFYLLFNLIILFINKLFNHPVLIIILAKAWIKRVHPGELAITRLCLAVLNVLPTLSCILFKLEHTVGIYPSNLHFVVDGPYIPSG
jgi:hypothetical protein